MTVNSFFKLIADALNKPFVIKGGFDKTKLHDWQVHYKYFELMQNNFEDAFGILVSKENIKVSVFEYK